MSYSFQTQLDRVGTRMQEINPRTITYYQRDGTQADSTLVASPITLESQTLIQEEGGIGVNSKRRYYVIDAEELLFSAVQTEPQHGDYLVDGTDSNTYKVVPPIEGMGREVPCFRYTTSSKKRIIIHTELWTA